MSVVIHAGRKTQVREGDIWSGWYVKGEQIGVVFGQAREGFMEEVNLYQRLMEVRKPALADIHRKRAFQAEKEKSGKS